MPFYDTSDVVTASRVCDCHVCVSHDGICILRLKLIAASFWRLKRVLPCFLGHRGHKVWSSQDRHEVKAFSFFINTGAIHLVSQIYINRAALFHISKTVNNKMSSVRPSIFGIDLQTEVIMQSKSRHILSYQVTVKFLFNATFIYAAS